MSTYPSQDEASSEPLRGYGKGPAEHITNPLMKSKRWSPSSQTSWPGSPSCTDATIQVRGCGMRKADTVLTGTRQPVISA